MSKPVYEIPVNGDESGEPLNFPPPARGSRPRNFTTAPPPAGGYPPAPTYSTAPEAPFTSPPPSIAPDGGSWPAPQQSSTPLAVPVSQIPMPASPAPATPPNSPAESEAQFQPVVPGFTPAPATSGPAFEESAPDMNFPPPTADSLNFTERMFAQDGASRDRGDGGRRSPRRVGGGALLERIRPPRGGEHRTHVPRRWSSRASICDDPVES